MNFVGVLFFVGLICAASAKLPMANHFDDIVSPHSGINENFVRFILGERVNFTCGWPDSQIDPVEPFTVTEFRTVVSGDSEFSSIDFTLRNADVTGQHNFCFSFFDFILAGMFIRFTMEIPVVNILGTHSTSAQLTGIPNPVVGNGNINMDALNVVVSVNSQMRTLPTGNLTLAHFAPTVSIGQVQARLTGFGLLDGTISRLVSAAAPGMVAENQDRINDALQNSLVPGLNRFLAGQNFNTLVSLMANRAQNPAPRSCFGPTPRTCPPLF